MTNNTPITYRGTFQLPCVESPMAANSTPYDCDHDQHRPTSAMVRSRLDVTDTRWL
ncbi:hypothetical protein [Luteitalea sp.]|uniref:hypothetical protein n=1 Tax=Luteitalea sp. TaxID=2004800 RepID=UPI0025BAFD4A|nr:hypothetical protein [Luteitalea sp.]